MKAVFLFWAVVSIYSAAWGAPPSISSDRRLRGHVPTVVAGLPPVGRLDATTTLPLTIGLPLRNQTALADLLRQIYDPASTNYHHYLTPERFTEDFGPTEQQYQTVIAFANRSGLAVTTAHPNRLVLEVSGTATDIEKAFQVTLREYVHPKEPRKFFAPDVEPVVAQDIPILDISGLDNYSVPRPKDLTGAPVPKAANQGSGPSGSYLGRDFRAAYAPDVALTGTGQSVGLFEFDGYYANDITQYARQAGLAAVPLRNVLLSGFDGSPGANNVEVALDIEMVISMAPGLESVVVYEGPSANSVSTANSILNRMATDNLAKQLSSSWNFNINATSEQIFQQFAAQGQSFFNASGDGGGYSGTIPTPNDNPMITIVGGTSLTTSNPGGAWVSETTWNWGQSLGASGGGISTAYPIPTWQEGLDMFANQGSTIMRNVPDVAMAADNVWVIYGNGKAGAMGGTSCASPLWAGFTALVNQQAVASGAATVGFLNPALYSIGRGPDYASTFHDTTTGNSGNGGGSTTFLAVPGYDLCTGWGSPVGQPLINALAGPPDTLAIAPLIGFTASGPVGGPFNVTAKGFSLTNSGKASLNWSLINTSLWLTASSGNGTLVPGGPSDSVTISLSSAANNLAVGAYTATIGFSNPANGVTQYSQFTVLVGQSLLQNGGFETGDFSYWNLTGIGAFTRVVPSSGTGASPKSVHTGSYGVQLGQANSLGFLSQTLPTSTGQPYLISLWLNNSFNGDTPNEFQVAWNSDSATPTIIYDQTNMAQANWTRLQFLVQGSSPHATLQLSFRNDPQYFGLDDLSVVPVPKPALRAVVVGGGAITLSWKAMNGLKYQIQYQTDLGQTNWSNLGGPLTATGANLSRSDVIGPEPERFYRVMILP
jgi:hypothetical protein